MLYVDIPTQDEIVVLMAEREPASVSLYLPATPRTQDAQADRIALKTAAAGAIGRLCDAGTQRREVLAVEEQLDDLVDDDEFWRFQAHSLAVLANPGHLRSWRLPNAIEPVTVVADRFHVKPLLRAVAFPQVAYVLALSAGGVRLLEVSPDLPVESVRVAGMPRDAASAVGKTSIKGRSHSGRIHGSEGENVRLRQYARHVETAVRPIIGGAGVPLVLAASERLGAIYRSVCTYPRLAAETIVDSADTLTDAELAARARGVLDGLYAKELAEWHALFETRSGQHRTLTDVAQAGRAAAQGAIASALVDLDGVVTGTLDEATGAVTFGAADGAAYGVVDAIAGLILAGGGRVLAVRQADIPGGQAIAAILRYPF